MRKSRTVLSVSVFIAALVVAFSIAWAKGLVSNTKLGVNALTNKSADRDNTAIGFFALHLDTSGTGNTAVGSGALQSNDSGPSNVAIGLNAMSGNVDGSFNTALGASTLMDNISGQDNVAVGLGALEQTTGSGNTAVGTLAFDTNITGSNNTAIGNGATITATNLTNATAIGAGAAVDASNKVRIGNTSVAIIQGEVAFTASSDATKKENFLRVNGEEVLEKLRRFNLASWNFIGHDPKQFRHYGPMAQDFFAAFGRDAIGTIGTPTTINSGDMAGILMIAVQALEKQNSELRARVGALEQSLRDRPDATASIQPRRERNAALTARIERLEELLRERTASAAGR